MEIREAEVRWQRGCWMHWIAPVWPVAGEPCVLKDTAAMACPMCDRAFSVVNHEIAPDGSISPSVVCPHAGCTFHVFMRLRGWSQ